MNLKQIVTVQYSKESLKRYSNYLNYEFMVTLGITFIENIEEEYNITLDNKYIKIPYFHLFYNNQDNVRSWRNIILKLLFASGAVLLICLIIIKCLSQSR